MTEAATTASAVGQAINPVAPHHLPWFMTAPGTTDYLLYGMLAFVILVVIAFGNLYSQLGACVAGADAHRQTRCGCEIVCVASPSSLFSRTTTFSGSGIAARALQFPNFPRRCTR